MEYLEVLDSVPWGALRAQLHDDAGSRCMKGAQGAIGHYGWVGLDLYFKGVSYSNLGTSEKLRLLCFERFSCMMSYI